MASCTGIQKFIFGIAALVCASAAAERPDADNIYQYIAGLGPITFNKAGGAFLPLAVLNGLKQGKVSPIMLFVLSNNMMNKCVEDVVKAVPDIRDPYTVAKAKFEYGVCRIKKCFQQGTLVLLLPQLSSNERAGGSSDEQDRSSAQQTGVMLAQAFKKDPGCDGASDGMDPMLLSVLMK